VAAAAANTTASDTTPPTYPADRSPWPTEPASPPSSRLRRLISDDDNDVDLSADTMRTATGGSAPLDDDRKLPAHQNTAAVCNDYVRHNNTHTPI